MIIDINKNAPEPNLLNEYLSEQEELKQRLDQPGMLWSSLEEARRREEDYYCSVCQCNHFWLAWA